MKQLLNKSHKPLYRRARYNFCKIWIHKLVTQLYTKDTIEFYKIKVITKMMNYHDDLTKSVELRRNLVTENKDNDLDISNIWFPIINMLKELDQIS